MHYLKSQDRHCRHAAKLKADLIKDIKYTIWMWVNPPKNISHQMFFYMNWDSPNKTITVQ